MLQFELWFKPSVRKDLDALSPAEVKGVLDRIRTLSHNPWPCESGKMSGTQKMYRLRVGYCRVIYEADSRDKKIIVHFIGSKNIDATT